MATRLKIEQDFSNYKIFGISCQLKDYKFSWLLNNEMNFNFLKIQSLITNEKKKIEYSIYEDKSDDYIYYYLLSNKSKNIPLSNYFKEFDYFLIIEGDPLKSQINSIKQELKKLPGILFISEINIFRDKNIGSILTDFELHITNYNKSIKEERKIKTPK